MLVSCGTRLSLGFAAAVKAGSGARARYQQTMRVVGRLAPTPSGDLHLGNVCAFGMAWLAVRARGGRLLLRMEDVDQPRARRAVEDRQRRELEWLGLTWDEETPRQSSRSYDAWLERLAQRTYRCRCSRADRAEASAGGRCPCRDGNVSDGATRFRLTDQVVSFDDEHYGPQTIGLGTLDDPLLCRRDGTPAYMLAVVVDDVRDGVSQVVRGADLLEATAVQIRLWQAFGATPPIWCHAPLILGADGSKLSKSHQAPHVGSLRESGWGSRDVWRVVLPWLGIDDEEDLERAAQRFDPRKAVMGPVQILDVGPRPGLLRVSVHVEREG